MIRTDINTILTPEILKKLVEEHQRTTAPRYMELENYYKGKHKILNRVMKDSSKPNNKVINPFANYITDMFVGYFMGETPSYSSQDVKALEELQMIFTYNDEQDENSELAKDASVYGIAYEMMYMDAEGNPRFKNINPKEVICVHDNTVEEELLYVIRYYKDKDLFSDTTNTMIEVYSKSDIRRYKASEKLTDITLIEETPHYFALVPFVEYKNNDDLIGDFELVISLIDAYDKLESDSLNDFEYFVDAYMALYGMNAAPEDIAMMKENRVLLMDEGAKAEWVIKNTNDSNIENIKTRLNEDIHKFAKCPAMTDKDFAGNASGVAMKFKVMGTENVASVKERKFKRGLQRRIELLANILGLTSNTFDWRSIEITFKRNLPVNTMEIADMINKLRGIVSSETLLLQLPFVEDVELELERLEQEKQASMDVFGGLGNGLLEGEAGSDSREAGAETGQDTKTA